MKRLYHDDPYGLANYVDLRDLQNEKIVLRNPHKGWYWHYIDNGFGRPAYRDRVEPGDWMTDFPGLNHLYLRFDWGDIEGREGERDWSYIDRIMDEWGAHGYAFSFRLCTYEGASAGPCKFATPRWVYDAGAKFRDLDGRLEPDYGDPVYLEKLASFMQAYGRKFDGDARVETVDIGTFGTWGEGHTFMGSGLTWPADVIRTHIDLHVRNFHSTHILLNDDMIGSREGAPNGESLALMEYARQLGVGVRDDSICVAGCCRDFGHYHTLRTDYLFDHFWRQAPVDIEFEHYHAVLKRPEDWQDGLPFIDALRRTHATFAGFHGYPRPWLKQFPHLTRYVANRLGYWYFIEGAQLPEIVSGARNLISLVVQNRGYAPAYHRYERRVRLTDAQTGRAFEQAAAEADNRRWMPNETYVERIRLDARLIPAGRYEAYAGLFDGDRPIQFGVEADAVRDGYVRLGAVSVR